MNVYGITDQGLVRRENQDHYACEPWSGGILAVVCDGMGGAKGGSVASHMAVDIYVDEMLHSDPNEPILSMGQAMSAANDAIRQKSIADSDCSGMGTTLVSAWVAPDGHAYVINVGDSRGYLIRPSGIIQITRDHSLVADLVSHGKLTAEQARVHPNKNIITRAVGTDRHTEGDLFEVMLAPGDHILLCSDGLSNTVTDQEILYEVLYGGMDSTCCKRLLEIALQRGAPDNVTAVLICTGSDENE